MKKKAESRLSSDILQLFSALVAIFFFLSLVSFSPDDPSTFTIVDTDEPVVFKNLFGNVGACFSAWLGAIFGWPAVLLPFLFAYLSVRLHKYKKELKIFSAPVVGFFYGLCIIISLSALSGLIGGKDLFFPKTLIEVAGGSLGTLAATFIQSIVGRVGGIVVFLFLITAFSMLLFSVSFSDMGTFFRLTWQKISVLFSLIVKRFSEARQRTQKESPQPDVSFPPEPDEPIREEAKRSAFILETAELEAIKDISYDTEKIEEHKTETEEYKENSLQPEPIFIETHEEEKEEIKSEPESKVITEESEPEEPKEESESEEEPEFKERVKTEQSRFDDYTVPLQLLAEPDNSAPQDSRQELQTKGELLVQKLKDFGVSGTLRAIQPGPVVTVFEYEPAPGTRVSKISSLDSDIALNMSATSVRIIAPIPGTNAVGIEMPNKYRATVYIKELFQSQEFIKSKSPLSVALGKDSVGRPYMADVAKMPHMLVAGTTGSGKSVALNVMICSVLYKSSPDMVKFIMVDPKAVELSIYDGIPHMLAPVVTDPKLAASVLKNVATEMDRRYNIFKDYSVRSMDAYNDIVKADGSAEPMPYIVVIVDEFADLMMVAGKEVETSIIRIAQKARAAGIHLIIATQRPDANVITGLIRSNMPARLGLRVSQKLNSRIILDQHGAETLLGRGDSLFLPPGSSDLVRVHGAFISDKEVQDIVRYLKTLGEPEYDMSMVKEEAETGSFDDEDEDPEYEKALEIAYEKGSVSISMIQRQLRIGYNKAARIVEMMEKRGIVGPSDGTAKPRPVIR